MPPAASASSPRIGLALGGGGARGLAHVAILETLDDMGITPSIIAGTSIGALIGAAYASGMSGREIRDHINATFADSFHLMRKLIKARSQPWHHFWNVLPLHSALLDPKAVLDIALPANIARNIEDCRIPLRVIATNMQEQAAQTFDRGNLKQHVAASIAIPVVFSPVTIAGQLYADGGISNPLPVNALADQCDLTVAIDVTSDRDTSGLAAKPRIPAMLVNSVTIFQKAIIAAQLRDAPPDLYTSLKVGSFHALQFHRSREILAIGDATRAEFRSLLQQVIDAHARNASADPMSPREPTDTTNPNTTC